MGGITAVIYFGLLAIFLDIMSLDYRMGVSVAYITAVAFHFFANRRLTFSSRNERPFRQVVRYLLMVAFNYLLTVMLVTVSVEKLGLSPYMGAAVAIVVTTGLGFFISKVWVFRKESIKSISG